MKQSDPSSPGSQDPSPPPSGTPVSEAAAGHQPASPAVAQAASEAHGHRRSGLWALTLGSIGVVYGDIGTSPLYAFREALLAAAGAHGSRARARLERA